LYFAFCAGTRLFYAPAFAQFHQTRQIQILIRGEFMGIFIIKQGDAIIAQVPVTIAAPPISLGANIGPRRFGCQFYRATVEGSRPAKLAVSPHFFGIADELHRPLRRAFPRPCVQCRAAFRAARGIRVFVHPLILPSNTGR
jgi:hypothetical protein